uniref:UTP6 small subunit processome component n=1 Tax=Oryzias sinensis TaxID=183150 RepID=A0A8C7WMW9_9TELE
MAEIVQQRIEDRIPELEQLERVGLFTKKEVKSVVKRVTALEYKLHRLIVNKEDFIAYIQYEINVLELIKKRRAHIHYKFKREEIEFPIIHRIHGIFRRATKKWKDDVQLWLSHVAFCKKWVCKAGIPFLHVKSYASYPPWQARLLVSALWIMAAKSELEDQDSSESARHLFLRALRFHPNNKKVYQEYFRMELLHAEKLRKQKAELEKAEIDLFSPAILSGRLADVVYKDATGKIKEAEFVISLLNIAAIFDFTKELQDSILQDLQTNYAADSLMWDFMARRELEAPGLGEEHHSAKARALDINRREERCCQLYEEGLRVISTEPMWSRYLDFCLERLKRKTNVQELKEKVKKWSRWTEVWMTEVLLSDAEGAASVAMAATERYHKSVTTWSLSLQTLVQLGSGDPARLFQEALTHVNPKESLPLWQLQLQWSTANQTPEDTEAIFKSAVPTVAMEMKDSYLNWSYTTGGYKKARKTFKSLQENRPLSKSFFTRMVEIEKEQEAPKMNHLREYYERALQEFGTSDDDLWLQYIQEELSTLGQPENCGKIHWRAMKFLEGESVERFVSKYTLLQTGHA